MESEVTILIVDDSRENIDILLSLLDDYDLLVALNGPRALELTTKNDIDLILLDIVMPGMDGYEVCRCLKDQVQTRDIPILFITSRTDEGSLETAFASGASDYVTKPFRPRELRARVKTQIKLYRSLKKLEFAATRDALTGILNRREFFNRGQKMTTAAAGTLYAVMIDIDRFKRINDSYGHACGDQAIRLVTQRISDFLPADTIFGRLGGEEFAILIENDTPNAIQEQTEQIRSAIEKESFTCQEHQISISVSMGITIHQPGENLDSLLLRADQELYRAKGSGRNRICFREGRD